MTVHDRFAAHELINKWWFNYDEGHLDVCESLLTEDCHLSSRTELGNHPHEQFIRSDSHGRDVAMAWTKEHRKHSPYPLRHHAANVHVVAERGDEIDVGVVPLRDPDHRTQTEHVVERPRPLHARSHTRRLPHPPQGDRSRFHRIRPVQRHRLRHQPPEGLVTDEQRGLTPH